MFRLSSLSAAEVVRAYNFPYIHDDDVLFPVRTTLQLLEEPEYTEMNSVLLLKLINEPSGIYFTKSSLSGNFVKQTERF